MSKAVEQVGVGAALIGGAVALEVFTAGLGTPLASILASAGAGMVLSGVGTLLSQKANGISTTSRNPIAPWQCVYGRAKVGGTLVYIEEVADNNRILLLVAPVACHPCDAIEQTWLNNKPIVIGTNSQFADQGNPNGFWVSFNANTTYQIETISRVNDVVSVTFAPNPAYATYFFGNFNGQTMRIENSRDSAGGNSFDGYFPVVQTGPYSFTYTCGGPQGPGTGNPGHVATTWPQYGGNVTVGYYLGTQTQASGMILGNTAGYWTSAHVLQGRTYVALKLVYNSAYFTGLPEMSYVVRGKNDIYDPRTGKKGYTNNAALCIADYLAHPLWGFNDYYESGPQPLPGEPKRFMIPDAELIAAANICDEQVPLALGGSEARYTCDGAFDVSVKRGDVLQNLLTSCGGRLIEMGGCHYIQPAAWVNPVGSVTVGGCASAPKMMMSSIGLVPEFFNSPAAPYVPACAGTSKSQFIYALGMLQAFQATGNSNALNLAQRALAPIASILFRGVPIPSPVTAKNIWSPNWAFGVKQAFLGDGGATISPTQDFASDFATAPGWRALQGLEVQTNGDAYNWAIRLFGLAAAVIDNTFTTANPDPGYGLSAYGDTYGDPEVAATTVNSSWILALNAILKMAGIAYQINFSSVSGNTLTELVPAYAGAGVPFAVEFTGTPTPELSTWIGPYYTGYQSPYAIRQVNGATDARVASAVQFLSQAQNQLTAQQTVADTVVFTITGANPQTVTVPVEITPSGTAIAQLAYEGHNVGVDTITGALASHGLTSNAAKIAWSAYTVPIAVYGVQIAVYPADGTGFFSNALGVQSIAAVQGLEFNAHPQANFPGDPHASGNQANPFVSNIVNTQGQYVGDQAISGTSSKFNAVITGGFTVDSAGPVTFRVFVNSRFVLGVQGASYVSGERDFGALSGGTYINGYPALVGNNAGAWPGGNWAEVDFTLSFPAPGLYQFEVDYASGLFSERQFELQAFGRPIPTINLAAGTGTTATGTAPSGQAQLTPYSGGAAIGTQAVFVLSLTGISYAGPGAGPFAPVYYFQVPAGAQTWGVHDTWGFTGPDPNTLSGYYQYRPLVEMCDLIAICNGSETYYGQATTVANVFIAWIAGKWTTAAAGPPNYFPQTGAQTTAPDIHCAALVMHAALALDLQARPTGAGTIDPNRLTCINEAYGMFITYYLSAGPMAGTFCLNATGAQDWSPIWHGELLRSLSMLVTWANVNAGQGAVLANATTWINGLVNFSLNQVAVVDQDLGFTVNDLSGAVKWNPKLAKTNLFNAIKGTYISESNQWQQSDFPTYAQDQLHGYTNGTQANNYDQNVDEDGERLVRDVQLPFTTSVSMAQRLAKIELLRIRQQGRGVLAGMMSLYQCAPLDVVYFSFAPFAWVNKVLEIANIRLLQQKTEFATVLSTEIDIQESDPSVYEWDVTEELNNQGESYVPGLQNLSPD